MFRSNKTWNRGFLKFLLCCELGGLISSIQINTHAEKDVIIWKNSDAGAFSVKGAFLNNQRNRFAEKKELWKWLWDSKIHPRQSMMLWRAIAGALPTSDKFGGCNSNDCSFCWSESENPLHLFVRCSMVRALWFGGPLPIKIELISGNTLFEFTCSAVVNLDVSSRHTFLVWFASILETVWLWRNRIHHGSHVQVSLDTLLLDVKKRFIEMSEIKQAYCEKTIPTFHCNPSPGVVSKVIVTDGSFKEGNFGGVMVAIDRVTNHWFIRTTSGKHDSPIAAEL
ncbi:hypothetical protein CsatA_000724 [Cannabis sativa]